MPSAAEALRTFFRDGPYLFAGAAFVTVGLLAAGFAAVQRKRDLLLFYFALFAGLYGLRLWVQADVIRSGLRNSTLYWRLSSALNYLMPLPAVLFFNATGVLRRWAGIAFYGFAFLGIGLTAAVFIFGYSGIYDAINGIAAIIAVLAMVIELTRGGSQLNPDLIIFRRGVLVFGAFVVLDNLSQELKFGTPKFEPIGFAVLLGAMGYVAAYRTLQRDHALREIQKELDVAKRIQLSILPGEFPPSAHFQVAARYLPMTSVAGDFYDYVLTDSTQAGVLIADVSGHGVPAALIASMVKLAAASQRMHAAHPGQFLLGMNATLCGNTQNQFVTAAYLYLDAKSREFRYSAAGHPPMLLARNEVVTEIEENGLMLAVFDFAAYSHVERPLEHGDRLLMYTDGVIEAADAKDEFFGRERLAALLVQTMALSASEAADTIVAAVRNWSLKQDDDVTVILCDFVDGRTEIN
jgi:phosphoserine phosphatase RsbU/P